MSKDKVYPREWRLAKGLNQPDLARRIGATKSAVSRLEKGSRKTTMDWMSRIAEALGVSVEDLLSPPPIGFGTVAPPPAARQESRGPPPAPAEGVGDFALTFGRRYVPVTVSGDEWPGAFAPGDILIADTARASVGAGGLFAVSIGDDVVVRRAVPSPEGDKFVAGNQDYAPLKTSDVKVIGRIVGRVHRV